MIRVCLGLWVGLAMLYSPPGDAEDVQPDIEPEEVWYDQGHRAVSDRTEQLAVWADNFFGTTRSVEEAPSSVLRLRPEYEWDEEDGSDWKLRAKGRLKLPKVNKRLSLVFISDEDDASAEFYDPGIVSDGKSTAGLEYRLAKSERSRTVLFAGLKAGPKGKLGARYRYQLPFLERNRFRFSEELFWIGGDGFGTLTRVDIDHSLNKRDLLRWANKAEYSEESNGVEWSSRLIWARKIDQKSAFSSYVGIRGDTDPEILKSRSLGVAYRRQFLRDWLFWEVAPQYSWRKDKPGDDREGVTIVKVKLEIVFGDL